MKVAITTSAKMTQEKRAHAKKIADELSLPYIERKDNSLQQVWGHYETLFVWTATGWEAQNKEGNRYAYHPGTAMFRYKRWKLGEREPFIEAVDLKRGDSFLDCTFGFGSDCLMASLAVGKEGQVFAVEKSAILAFLFERSQFTTDLRFAELNEALKRIIFSQGDAVDFLKNQADNSYDVVYIDPMFEQEIEESTNFQTHKKFAATDQLTQEWVKEAVRVARRRVVLKAHFTSELFNQYGFEQLHRKSSKFHFGVLTL